LGHCTETTSNREELKAAIAGLAHLKHPAEVDLYTDSKYVINGITEWIEGWRRKGWKTSSGDPVKNKDLWLELDAIQREHTVHWRHVKGHQEGPDIDEHARWNGWADMFAVQERLLAAQELEATHES